MVAPMMIASGVQAALGAYSAIRGSKSAKAAKKEAAAAQAKKMENLGQTLDYQKQLYSKFEALYNPMAKEAQSSKSYGYDQSSAELQKQYANAQKNIAESQGLGGIAAGASRQAQFGLATGLAQKYSEGTQLRDQMRMKLMGEPIKQGQYVAGAMDNISGAYGEQYQAAREDQAAGEKAFSAGLAQVGSAIGSGLGSMQPQQGINEKLAGRFGLDSSGKISTSGSGSSSVPLEQFSPLPMPSGRSFTSTNNGTTTTGKF